MARVAKFKVYANLDLGRPGPGTVTVYREAGTFAVRPKGRRREYSLPLATVASMVVSKVVKAEVAEQRRDRKARRRAR